MNAITALRDSGTALGEFLDMHTHILPGLDDGPKDLAGSLALARMYEKAGIRKIVATPHFLPGTAWAPTKERVLECVKKFCCELGQSGIELQVLPGMEIAYHKKVEERILARTLLPLGNSDFYLIEPSFQGEQEGLLSSVGSLLDRGVKIILAHPERVEAFQETPRLLGKYVALGLKIQVNAGSLLGYFGEKTRRTAELLHRENYLHLIASDAHDHVKRAPLNAAEWQRLLELPGGDLLISSCNRFIVQTFGADAISSVQAGV